MVDAHSLLCVSEHVAELALALNRHKDIASLTADHRPFAIAPDTRLEELVNIVLHSFNGSTFLDVIFVNLLTSPNIILAEPLEDTSSNHGSEDVVELISKDEPTSILASWHLNLANKLREILEDLEESLLALPILLWSVVVVHLSDVLCFLVGFISAQLEPSSLKPLGKLQTVAQDMKVRVICIVVWIGLLVSADVRLVLYDTTLLTIYQILLMMIGALKLSKSYDRTFVAPLLSLLEFLPFLLRKYSTLSR